MDLNSRLLYISSYLFHISMAHIVNKNKHLTNLIVWGTDRLEKVPIISDATCKRDLEEGQETTL